MVLRGNKWRGRKGQSSWKKQMGVLNVCVCVCLAKKNQHRFPSPSEEEKALIYNDSPVFCGLDSIFIQNYYFD